MKTVRPASLLFAVVSLCSFADVSRGQSWIGTGNTTYSWNDTANWSGGTVPNGNSAVATFRTSLSSDVFTVNLPTNITLEMLSFNANQLGSVTVGSTGGALTLSTNGNENGLVVADGSGAHVINTNLIIAGSSNIGSRLWQVNGNSILTINGTVSQFNNSRSIAKTGTGTVFVSGSNTFAGGFFLLAGSAYITNTAGSGTGSGTVATSLGTTLGGTGIITGPLLVGASVSGGTGTAKIAPGTPTAVGTLTVLNTVTFGTNTELVVRLNGATNGSYDQLSASGAIDLTGSTLTGSVAGGYNPAFGDKLFIVVNSGSGTTAGNFNGLPEGATVTFSGHAFTIHYGANFEDIGGGQPLTGGNDVALAPVPEPATCLGVAAVGALAVRLRRRRNRA